MSELQNDPAVVKLLEYAKAKKSISYDEVNDFLPDSIVNSDKIEEVIILLESNNISLEEEDISIEEEPEKKAPAKKIVYNEKEAVIDDPIRLYLREIGKENLLTAEQEVELSKQMEEGENIIRNVIKNSGMIIPEMHSLAVKTFSKLDPREMDLSKKEIAEILAERRRLNQFYREPIRELIPELKQYFDTKKRLIATGGDLFTDQEILNRRKALLPLIQKIEIHQDEILQYSEKFLTAEKKIRKYRSEQKKIEKRLRVSSSKELRSMGRGLAITEQRKVIEENLQLSADAIKE
jgi:RNA polymerase primary sigma factor